MTNEELAYIAGFFDGEGSVTIHENGRPSPRGKSPNHTLQASIGNTDPRVIEWIHKEFGGTLTYRKVKKANHRNAAQLNMRARKALPFLEAIYPFLRMKKDQVRIAIKYQKTKSLKGPFQLTEEEIHWRELQRQRIRELNCHPWITGDMPAPCTL